MTKLAIAEKTILFINNFVGDDLWEFGHHLISGSLKGELPHELMHYKNGSKARYNSDGIYVTSITAQGLQLYGFPFMPDNVEPFDVDFPSSIDGIVITQDMRMLDFFVQQDPGFHHTANPCLSKLAWAKGKNIPVVLAVHHVTGFRVNTADLDRLIGMETYCPVIWHRGNPNASFFKKAIKALPNSI